MVPPMIVSMTVVRSAPAASHRCNRGRADGIAFGRKQGQICASSNLEGAAAFDTEPLSLMGA